MKKIISFIAAILILSGTSSAVAGTAYGLKGDVNSDGRINGADLEVLNNYLLGMIDINEFDRRSADLNNDNVVDIFDLIILRGRIVKTEGNIEFQGITSQLFSGYKDSVCKVAAGNIETNDSAFIAHSVEEMNRYLNVFYEAEVVKAFNEKYTEKFFEDSVLLLNSLYQTSGKERSAVIHSVEYKDGTTVVSMRKTNYENKEDICSAILIHISVLREDYLEFPIKWVMKEAEPEIIDPAENKKIIEVKNILQSPELPTGCEVTSLSILLEHMGYNANKVTLARNYLPKQDFYWENGIYYGADFRTVFAGDPESPYSYGCYAPCIVITANRYLANVGADKKAYDVSGKSFESLMTSYIDKDKPVLIWITSSDLHESELTSVWTTPAGERVQWRSYEHCVVLTGYDKEKGLVYVSDPMIGNTAYSYNKLVQRFNEMGKQAVTIE